MKTSSTKEEINAEIQKQRWLMEKKKTSTCDECVSIECLEFIKFTAINNTGDNLKFIIAF